MSESNPLNNPNLVLPGCYLSAYGKGFNPELFFDGSDLWADLIVFSGKIFDSNQFENVPYSEPGTATLFDSTFLALRISDAVTGSAQSADAILFVRKYSEEVRRLAAFDNVERVELRFKTAARNDEELPDEIRNLARSAGVRGIAW
jgi:hypothetical protein